MKKLALLIILYSSFIIVSAVYGAQFFSIINNTGQDIDIYVTPFTADKKAPEQSNMRREHLSNKSALGKLSVASIADLKASYTHTLTATPGLIVYPIDLAPIRNTACPDEIQVTLEAGALYGFVTSYYCNKIKLNK